MFISSGLRFAKIIHLFFIASLFSIFLSANALAADPTITSPASGSQLTGSSQVFTWNYNGTAVEQWALYVGSSVSNNDYFVAGAVDNATTTTATGIPTNGSTVYVRLWYRVGAVWSSVDTTYIAANIAPPALPTINSPTPGSTLTGSSQTFTWSYNGNTVDQWALYVGSTVSNFDYYVTGAADMAATATATGIPTDGSTVYVRLWYRIGALWSSIDATYTAATIVPPTLPSIASPTPGSTLTGSSQVFTWNYNGNAVEQWALYVGSTVSSFDYYVTGASGAATTATATGIPTDGSTVYVRLWYRVGALWSSIDATYTAATITPPVLPSITSPTPGSTLTGSSQVFTWNYNGNAVEQWALYAGSAVSNFDYYVAGAVDNATTTTVTGLPTDGSTVYVRLWYRVGTLWSSIDVTYTAFTASAGNYTCPSTPTTEGTFNDTFVTAGTADVPWPQNLTFIAVTVADIQGVFNTARQGDTSLRGEQLNMPTQAVWDAMTVSEKVLFLINSERCARGIRPYEGIDLGLAATPAQTYANFLAANAGGVLSHTADGRTPFQRMTQDAGVVVGTNADFFAYGENLAFSAVANSAAFPTLHAPVAKAVYGWIYDDKADTNGDYGHRKFILATGLIENSGAANQEGVIGVGVASDQFQQDGFFWTRTYSVLNGFDPNAARDISNIGTVQLNAPEACLTGYTLVTLPSGQPGCQMDN